jgi:hypothetical protein
MIRGARIWLSFLLDLTVVVVAEQYGKADRRKAYRTLAIALALFAATTLLWMFMWHRACGPDAPDGGQCFEKYGTGWRLAWIVFRGLALVRLVG